MATEQHSTAKKNSGKAKGQANTAAIDRKARSGKHNVDNGENQVSNGIQSTHHNLALPELATQLVKRNDFFTINDKL